MTRSLQALEERSLQLSRKEIAFVLEGVYRMTPLEISSNDDHPREQAEAANQSRFGNLASIIDEQEVLCGRSLRGGIEMRSLRAYIPRCFEV